MRHIPNENTEVAGHDVRSGPFTERIVNESPSVIRDILLLFVLPCLLMVIIFVTTDPSNFEYKVAEPSIWGIYASNISHRTWTHLVSNLIGLVLIGGVEYAILTASGYRKHYFAVFLGVLFVLPVFGHVFLQFVLVNNPVFQSYEAVGFSEPLAAMVAYFPFALATYLSKIGRAKWPILLGVLLYAGGTAWAITQLFGPRPFSFILGAFGLIGVTWIGIHLRRTNSPSTRREKSEYARISIFVLVVFISAVWALFPGDNVGTMVGHLAGYISGFFVPVAVLWGFSLLKPEHDLAINLD